MEDERSEKVGEEEVLTQQTLTLNPDPSMAQYAAVDWICCLQSEGRNRDILLLSNLKGEVKIDAREILKSPLLVLKSTSAPNCYPTPPSSGSPLGAGNEFNNILALLLWEWEKKAKI